jgi:hypothetical protein
MADSRVLLHSPRSSVTPFLLPTRPAVPWARRRRLGPVQIAGRPGVPASTVHELLTRCRINRPSDIDRVTGEPPRRYEHGYPGTPDHVDVTKFGNIPDGGSHKFPSRHRANATRATDAGSDRIRVQLSRSMTSYNACARHLFVANCCDGSAAAPRRALSCARRTSCSTRWEWRAFGERVANRGPPVKSPESAPPI